MTKPVEHSVGQNLPRTESGHIDGRLVQFRQRIFHNDAAHSWQSEHAGVVASVAGDQYGVQCEVEPFAKPAQCAAFGGVAGQHVQIAPTGIDHLYFEPCFRELSLEFANRLRLGLVKEPAGFKRVLEFIGLGADSWKSGSDFFDAGEIPSIRKMRLKVSEHLSLAYVKDLRSNSADIIIRCWKSAVVHEASQIVHQSAAVVDQQRATFRRERGPSRL